METAGFYKLSEGELVWGPNAVHSPTYTLLKEEKDTYNLPVDGWYWFNSLEEAKAFFEVE